MLNERDIPNPFLWDVTTPSLLLTVTRRGGARLVGAVAGLPQQRRAEDADDSQVEEEADGQHPDSPQEGGRRPVGQERRPA